MSDIGGGPIGYKPALLAGRQFIDAGDTHLVCTDGDGREKWTIAWNDITALAFVDHTIRGARMSRLDIGTQDRRAAHSISCNCASLNSPADPDYRAFREALTAVSGRLAEIAPDLPITIGEYGRARLWMFIVGCLSAIGAIGMSIAAAASGRGDALMGEALVPVVALLLLGLFFAWTHVPWRKPPAIPVRLFAEAMSAESNEDAGG